MKDDLFKPLEAEPPSPPQVMTVDEALDIAILLQRQGELNAAEVVFSRIRETAPEHPRALHYSGILAHQLGRTSEGVALMEQSLALVPAEADWHSNLGLVLQESTRLDEAICAYRRAIELNPNHANAYNNMGVLLKATGEPLEAETAYRKAIELNPSHADAYTNLGVLLNGLQRTEEAAACFCRAITLRPSHPEARRLLALAHCTLGEVDEAVRIFEEWLAETPDDPIALHMLAACSGNGVPDRASDAYVEATFDSFATSFESKLAKLSYRAPSLVSAMLDEAGLEASRSLDVLDVGCGTGLCGALIEPYARRLTGVDLSAGMLAQAGEKAVYHELVQAELTTYLEDHQEAFDVIVSADTLVYFGALEVAIGAAARALRPDGVIAFTLEQGADGPGPGYRLEQHGRYSHTRRYVEDLLERHGLVPEIVQADLRLESGVPVGGLVVRGRKARGTAP